MRKGVQLGVICACNLTGSGHGSLSAGFMDNVPLDLVHGDDLDNTINDFSKNVSEISEAGRFEIIVWGDGESMKDFFSVL